MNEIREKPKTYKIGYRAKRKNAVRHLALSFEAFSPEEAKLKYSEFVYNMNKSYDYKLYTGDWKEVCITGMKETVARNEKLRRKNELTAIIDKLQGRTVLYKDAIMKIHAGRYATFDNLVLTLFDPEEGPFSNITVNIEQLPVDEFAVDINNFPGALQILTYNNIAHPTEKVLRSGFCIYPVWKLNEEVLKEYE